MLQAKLKRVAIFLALAALLPQPSFSQTDSEFRFPDNSDYPKVRATGATVESFIPKGWTTLGKAKGDLNGDKLDDVAIVLKAELPEFKQDNSTGFGARLFDTNPRMLLILFKEPKKKEYRLAEQNNNLIVVPDTPTMLEPFDFLSIKNGALEVNFMLLYSAGTWSASKTCYKFRYQGNQFVLIGADKHELQRNSGDKTDFSINFLTGRMKVSTSIPREEFTSQTIWSKFRSRQLRTMSSFKSLYEWQARPGLYL